MSIDTAVIPAAGLGTRMAPATRALSKAMLPLGGKPVVQHLLEELAAAGLARAVVVVGHGAQIVAAHLHGLELGIAVELVDQPEPRGLGDAVLRAAPAVGGSPFVCALGDNVVLPGDGAVVRRLVDAVSNGGVAIAVEEVGEADVVRCGIVDAPPGGGPIRAIVEKPAVGEAPSLVAVAGRYVLGPAVLDALWARADARGGELGLTEAIQDVLSAGAPGIAVPLVGGERRLDTGSPAGYAAAFTTFALADPVTREAVLDEARRG
jgi:UTP--glucose-1-phosphate uridylyltransferase